MSLRCSRRVLVALAVTATSLVGPASVPPAGAAVIEVDVSGGHALPITNATFDVTVGGATTEEVIAPGASCGTIPRADGLVVKEVLLDDGTILDEFNAATTVEDFNPT